MMSRTSAIEAASLCRPRRVVRPLPRPLPGGRPKRLTEVSISPPFGIAPSFMTDLPNLPEPRGEVVMDREGRFG